MGLEKLDLVVLGSVNTDYSFYVSEFPLPGETLLSHDMATSPGGKGGNQAVAAARMGASVAMLGCVGDDERGRDLLGYLGNNGVDTSSISSIRDYPTGLASIFVRDGGENLIVVSQGANGQISTNQVKGASPAKYYLSQLETPLPVIRDFFKQGRRQGVRCVLNAAPADKSARELFSLCDVIIINEVELATYAECDIAGESAEAAGRIAAKLLSNDEQTIIVTRGSRGAIAVRRGATLAVGAHQAEAIDTTGAGDCFCGALVATLADGSSLAAAISRANAAASLAIQRVGAASGLPIAAEVDAVLVRDGDLTPRLRPQPAD